MKSLKLIALISVAILIFLPCLAFAKGKPPNPPVEPTVVYTVALTPGVGVFTFPAKKVTLNSRGYLKSLDTGSLVLGRPDDGYPDEQDAWDAVIKNCAGPLGGDPTVDVMVINFDDWAVGRNGDDGNLWINFQNIRLPNNLVPEKEIQIQLQLRDDPKTQTFPPTDINSPLTFDLNWYVVWGKPLSGKGKKGWDTCYHVDVNADVDFLPAELVIAIAEGD